MYYKYFRYVLRHKWYVFIEACKLGVPWRGFVHDLSKFLPSEFAPYANFFYGKKTVFKGRDESGYYKPVNTGDDKFDYAWLLHQKRNKHHWQWWLLPTDEEGNKVFDMPVQYRKEMLADWRGAGKALGTPDVLKWYVKNRDKMVLHPETRKWVEDELKYNSVNVQVVLDSTKLD
jgi:hypothetical protein